MVGVTLQIMMPGKTPETINNVHVGNLTCIFCPEGSQTPAVWVECSFGHKPHAFCNEHKMHRIKQLAEMHQRKIRKEQQNWISLIEKQEDE